MDYLSAVTGTAMTSEWSSRKSGQVYIFVELETDLEIASRISTVRESKTVHFRFELQSPLEKLKISMVEMLTN